MPHLLRFIPLAVLLLISLFSRHALADTAISVVERLHDQLIENMQAGESLDYQGRYDKLEPVIRESFDFPLIARVVLGADWKNLDEAQREEFIETFTRLSIASYAAQFKSYSAEQFTTLGDEERKKGRMLVKTALQTSERSISFNYVLQPADKGWRIINVVVDGVSDLSLKRSDYGATLKNEGFSQLVRKLQEKIELSENPPLE